MVRRLLTATSVSAIALAAPAALIAPAFAQALPPGCSDAMTSGTPNDNNGVFNTGETITCVFASTVSQINTAVDDLTIIIGDALTPTAVAAGPGQAFPAPLQAFPGTTDC